ncbi:hypothetical protein C8R45DRAFT_947807 [Mycena sanguinolenta]|nr:hypothetical protein C8R45DRAFT_947807 [Mycena sanguinolenta]
MLLFAAWSTNATHDLAFALGEVVDPSARGAGSRDSSEISATPTLAYQIKRWPCSELDNHAPRYCTGGFQRFGPIRFFFEASSVRDYISAMRRRYLPLLLLKLAQSASGPDPETNRCLSAKNPSPSRAMLSPRTMDLSRILKPAQNQEHSIRLLNKCPLLKRIVLRPLARSCKASHRPAANALLLQACILVLVAWSPDVTPLLLRKSTRVQWARDPRQARNAFECQLRSRVWILWFGNICDSRTRSSVVQGSSAARPNELGAHLDTVINSSSKPRVFVFPGYRCAVMSTTCTNSDTSTHGLRLRFPSFAPAEADPSAIQFMCASTPTHPRRFAGARGAPGIPRQNLSGVNHEYYSSEISAPDQALLLRTNSACTSIFYPRSFLGYIRPVDCLVTDLSDLTNCLEAGIVPIRPEEELTLYWPSCYSVEICWMENSGAGSLALRLGPNQPLTFNIYGGAGGQGGESYGQGPGG